MSLSQEENGMKYGYPQDPKVWKKAKIVFRDIAKHPTFWLDLNGTVVNGDCYWISCSEENELTWLALAVGNSSVHRVLL